jgi:hypothetical protein
LSFKTTRLGAGTLPTMDARTNARIAVMTLMSPP